jgi:CheY-like chemotaxis protein
MGMNIVKRAVARMGGEIKVESQAGAFTRFRLSLPLFGAITQGLLFKIGGQVYAVPAAHVIEVLAIGHNVLAGTTHSASESGELPAIAGVSVPILKLHALLGLELPPGRRAAALHVRYAGRNFLITCDKVIGPRTIVVRPPGPLIGLIPIYSGVTASGAGKAQLVLDLGALADVAYAGTEPTTAPPRRGQPRVLVVDDSRLAREAGVRLLSAAGYQAVAAEDGWEAWEVLSERRFDAVVTALEMPRLDGFQLIARIRREATLRGLPIIVLSSRTSQAARDRALAAGANVFLPKSRHRRSLVAAVTACLNQARRRRARGRECTALKRKQTSTQWTDEASGHGSVSRCRPGANTGSSGTRSSSSAYRAATTAKRIRCGPSTGLRSESPGDHVSRGALQVWAPAPAARFVSIVRRSNRWDSWAASCPCYRPPRADVNFSDTLSGTRLRFGQHAPLPQGQIPL